MLSKQDYCNVVYQPLPDYQMKRLQRVQNICTGYVLKKFASLDDLKEPNWLPVATRIELSVFKLTHKAL